MECALQLVGVAGFEPTTSSSRSRSDVVRGLPVRGLALVTALVCIGLRRGLGSLMTRSSPRLLPRMNGYAPLIRSPWHERLVLL
jgi:hypothetical protein